MGELPAGCGPGGLKIKKPSNRIAAFDRTPAPSPSRATAGAPQSLVSDTMPVRQRWPSISVGHVMKRPRAADSLSQRVAGELDPKAIAERTIGPIASAETREAVDGAESKPQALALLLMAPEFLRR